ncbi:Pentatricopeptide repeat (PPR) superfamily protein [Rhynchospora pubera]|uniref:Pentatricopeptide repeat (PPR) superfamily protein n=1 Tax=Rhynchospora pubera TaxID=906938 RepID=A0AAV8HZ93_9POAL|nr:Pentatricopeptide repeat (PPR) superfamily protein [Rhynchospora pubera]
MRKATKLLSYPSPLFQLRYKSAQAKPYKTTQPDSASLYQSISSIIPPPSITNQLIMDPKSQQRIASPPVCPNASTRGNIDRNNSPHEEDVSPIVQRITEVVRSDQSGFSMEQRLDQLCLPCDPEIVAMVLKRCFKLCHLALRFFNWVKSRPGFYHSTETYNTMLYIAGDTKKIDLMEWLVEEMEKDACQKDIKTWTILIMHYGNTGRVGKALSTFQSMKKSGCEPDYQVYKVILSALCYAEKPELALEFYKEMVSKNMALNLRLFQMLLNCLVELDDKECIQPVRDDLTKAMNFSENEGYVCLLKSYCIKGKVKAAQEVFGEMTKKNMVSTEAYEIFLKGLCRGGMMEEALEMINSLKINSSVSKKAYGFLIDGFLRKGDMDKAIEIFATMREAGLIPDISSYTQAMQHLFRGNRHQDAFKLFDEMLEQGIQPDTVVITALVAGYISLGKISEAWGVLKGTREKGLKLSLKSYTVLIKELCRVSFPQEALKVLEEMMGLGINPSDSIINLVIGCLTKIGNSELVEKAESLRLVFNSGSVGAEQGNISSNNKCAQSGAALSSDTIDENWSINDEDVKKVCDILYFRREWSEIQKKLERENLHYTPEMVDRILQKCTRHGGVALKFFSWVAKRPNYKHNTCTYNMAIKIAGGAKDFQHMRYLYLEMRRNRCPVMANTWTIMISQYGQAGLTEMALRAFKEMKREGYQPDRSTYKYLTLFLCGKKGRKVDEAVQIFKEMTQTVSVPDKETIDTYLSMLCEVGKMEDARRSVVSLCKLGFEMQVVYSVLIKAMCRAGRIDEALALLHDIKKIGCTIDQYMYASIIHSLLRGGRDKEALDKVEEMKRVGIPCTTYVYTSLIVHFFKERNSGKALEIFRKMQEEGCELTVVTYSALIRGFMNNYMVKEAWGIFYKMKLKGPFPDFETYSMFMRSLCKAGRSEDALLLIHEMLDMGIIPSTINFRTVFYGLNREGKNYLARSVLQEKWKLNRERKCLN